MTEKKTAETPAVRLALSFHDVLALKAGMDVLTTDRRRGEISAPDATPDQLDALITRLQPVVERESPATVALTPAEAAVLAHYVERAMRLRGYVVGRPEANEWFTRLYRKLKAASRGEPGTRGPSWRRLFKRLFGPREE